MLQNSFHQAEDEGHTQFWVLCSHTKKQQTKDLFCTGTEFVYFSKVSWIHLHSRLPDLALRSYSELQTRVTWLWLACRRAGPAISAGTREEARCGNLNLQEPQPSASLITHHAALCLQHRLAQAGSRELPTAMAFSLRGWRPAKYAARPRLLCLGWEPEDPHLSPSVLKEQHDAE